MPGGVNLSSSGLSSHSAHRAFREKGETQGPGVCCSADVSLSYSVSQPFHDISLSPPQGRLCCETGPSPGDVCLTLLSKPHVGRQCSGRASSAGRVEETILCLSVIPHSPALDFIAESVFRAS